MPAEEPALSDKIPTPAVELSSFYRGGAAMLYARDETASTARRHGGVVLVAPPFGLLGTPSLALSILGALSRDGGFPTLVRYSTLAFAAAIGRQPYEMIASGTPTITDLVGEWLFAETSEQQRTSYFRDIFFDRSTRRRVTAKEDLDRLKRQASLVEEIRRSVPAFIESEAEAIAARCPSLVGFSTTFQQTNASLALAGAIKRRLPGVFVVFGGANCEAPMGQALLRQYEVIDAVVSGEGERDFVRLLGVKPPSNDRWDLEASPIPDFSDYFAQFEEWGFSFKPHLPYECSRGCWWGARTHCVFCGLNGNTMSYRAKSATKVDTELRCLTSTHPGTPVDLVDNILSMAYFEDLLPMLAREPLGVPVFAETKANLKWPHLQALQEAGFDAIQPGIESLSDSVLKLMGKGVSAIQNIFLLRACRELGIRVSWNWLWGFPNESREEYVRLATLPPFLEHLEPPVGAGAVRLDRYSPLFERAHEFGLKDIRPYPAYSHAHPHVDATELRELAYFFLHETSAESLDYTLGLAHAIAQWQHRFGTAELVSFEHEGRAWVWDTRGCARQFLTVLEEEDVAVLKACASPRALRELGAIPNDVVDGLVARGFLFHQGNSALALPLRLEHYTPSRIKLQMLSQRIAAEPSAAFPVSSLRSTGLSI